MTGPRREGDERLRKMLGLPDKDEDFEDGKSGEREQRAMAGGGKLDSILGVGAQDLRKKIDKRREMEKRSKFEFNKTPAEMFYELSQYVIGQQDAMQLICNAVCYHYKGLSKNIPRKVKNNVLLIGPTGCGKTYTIEKVAQLVDVPLVIADATKFSATGYVGGKVEDIIQDLVIKTEGDLNAASRGIIYVDEIDKVATRDMIGRDVSGRDVQNGLLKILEGGEIKVMSKDGEKMLSTKNMLFIGGGAFSDLYKGLKTMGFNSSDKQSDDGEALYKAQPYELIKALERFGMIPELLGRIAVIAKFRALSQDDLVEILTKSKDSMITACQRDFEAYGIKVNFKEDAYSTIARLAYERGIGARGLNSVIQESLTPFKFYLPNSGITEFTISSESVLKPEEQALALLEQLNKSQGGKS